MKLGRAPIFQFAFDRALFRLRAETPQSDPLFELPPAMASERFSAVV